LSQNRGLWEMVTYVTLLHYNSHFTLCVCKTLSCKSQICTIMHIKILKEVRKMDAQQVSERLKQKELEIM
jgi:hypothetical protein